MYTGQWAHNFTRKCFVAVGDQRRGPIATFMTLLQGVTWKKRLVPYMTTETGYTSIMCQSQVKTFSYSFALQIGFPYLWIGLDIRRWKLLVNLYPPLQRSWKWGMLVLPCPSVHPSVCDRSRVRTARSAMLRRIYFIFRHFIHQLQKVCYVLRFFLNSKIWMSADFCSIRYFRYFSLTKCTLFQWMLLIKVSNHDKDNKIWILCRIPQAFVSSSGGFFTHTD